MAYLPYDTWKETPEGKAKIAAALDEADVRAEFYQERKRLREEKAMKEYHKKSSERAKENGLIRRLGPNGALDDEYFAELPLDIGYYRTDDGYIVEFVSLGGFDVYEYLPPSIQEEIQRRIETYGEDHPF